MSVERAYSCPPGSITEDYMRPQSWQADQCPKSPAMGRRPQSEIKRAVAERRMASCPAPLVASPPPSRPSSFSFATPPQADSARTSASLNLLPDSSSLNFIDDMDFGWRSSKSDPLATANSRRTSAAPSPTAYVVSQHSPAMSFKALPSPTPAQVEQEQIPVHPVRHTRNTRIKLRPHSMNQMRNVLHPPIESSSDNVSVPRKSFVPSATRLVYLPSTSRPPERRVPNELAASQSVTAPGQPEPHASSSTAPDPAAPTWKDWRKVLPPCSIAMPMYSTPQGIVGPADIAMMEWSETPIDLDNTVPVFPDSAARQKRKRHQHTTEANQHEESEEEEEAVATELREKEPLSKKRRRAADPSSGPRPTMHMVFKKEPARLEEAETETTSRPRERCFSLSRWLGWWRRS
ncbi:hypothetical protein CYLTODRAFT_487442 [Cylindrobasidium torrendii FP15055 ss-10]|uniref:Uncharacterized protein n=1 Tax=Cylindrobasidium torrendii FP15055 ss-10 TaxID=1314674 RepID=A0A0D7BM59_9AGAR|nr:hypothetical protein CYLTODRAFT_487442 [Cylindrobasidium torrendii FP15055 ss-10]